MTWNQPPNHVGLAALELTDSDLEYAQDHLRILCGLYGTSWLRCFAIFTQTETPPTLGILRPLDLIQPYRLEMGQKFANSRGKDLYAFWGPTLAAAINRQFDAAGPTTGSKVLVNLASQEYFKSIPLDALDDDVQVVDCVFQDDGKVKSVYAKRARGLIVRYLIQNRVESVAGIQAFDLEGYAFAAKASSATTFVFTRTAATQKAVLKDIQAKAKLAKAAGNTPADTVETCKAEDDRVEAEAEAAAKPLRTRAAGRKKRRTR